MTDFSSARFNMVDSQLRPNGITDRRLLSAMLDVPREQFVPESRRALAYIDADIPLLPEAGRGGRSLLEPLQFARLVQLAEIVPEDLVLDVGCGTGYSTAVLARLAESVVGVECDPGLAAIADTELAEQGVDNSAVVTGPLELGYASQAPYDVIIVEGAVEVVPRSLLAQLREDAGRLVAIVSAGPIGKATVYRVTAGEASFANAADAVAPVLPGFARPLEFVF